jgi:hypothetical protein
LLSLFLFLFSFSLFSNPLKQHRWAEH